MELHKQEGDVFWYVCICPFLSLWFHMQLLDTLACY
jgi:hypothetical protein